MTTYGVRVQTVNLDEVGTRQIGPKRRTTELLSERQEDVEKGIQQAINLVRRSLAEDGDRDQHGWRVSSVEATFGITLSAEAGVVLTKASAEATFEVKLKVERHD